MKAFVFLNGGISRPEFYREHFRQHYVEGDVVYCANGGSRIAREAGVTPDFIIGDLDSMATGSKTKKVEEAKKIVYPEEKDFSDFELILGKLRETSVNRVIVYGALGGRIDHELINVLLLVYFDLEMSFIEEGCEVYNVLGKKKMVNENGKICTLFTPCGCFIKEMVGFKYILENHKLLPSSRGLSNLIVSDTAWISIGEGRLCLILIKK